MSQTKAQLLDALIASLLPASDSSVDIGSNGVRFANIYGDTLYGDGSNLTGITSTTINSNADNRLITGSGTANTLNGESGLTYDGSNLSVTGGFDASSDISLADTIKHTGDTNTKIRFPAADTFSVETGGSERMRIDSSGRLLVGTTDTPSKLTVDTDFCVVRSSSDPTINLLLGSSSSITQIYRILIDDSDSDKLQVRSGDTPRITMTTGGFVGIGQTNPSQPLHVLSTTNPGILSRNDSGGTGIRMQSDSGSACSLSFSDLDAHNQGLIMYHHADDRMQFNTAGSERMRINSSGNVGIGTTSPLFSAFGSNTGGLEISDVDTNNALLIQSGSNELFIANTPSANYIFGDDNAPLIIATNSTEAMRIKSNQNVGIGTTNPSSKLHVANDNSFAAKFGGSGGGSDYFIEIGQLGTSSSAGFNATGTTGSMLFRIDGSEKMRIAHTTGNVGIGTSSPVSRLHVHNSGTGSGDHAYAFFTTGDTGATASDGLTIGVAANQVATINYREAGDLSLGTSSIDRIRIHGNGDIAFNNCTSTINSSNYGLYLLNDSNSTKSIYLRHSREANGTHTTAEFHGNQGSMQVFGDGDLKNTNNSYGSLSDETLKQDIVDASSQWNDIKAIKVRKFRFKANPTGDLHIGVVAQELETVSPKLVTEVATSSDDLTSTETVKAVKYSILYMKAIKALQEAMTRIETLETEVAALKAA